MQGPLSVLYVGRDAESVERACRDSEGDVAVEGLDPIGDGADDLGSTVRASRDVETALDAGRFDAVVCRSDAAFDATALVRQIRDRSASLPVAVFAVADSFGPETAAELGVTTYLQVDPDFDAASGIEGLAPTIERHRETRRDRTILDSLLAHLPLSIYVKDRRGRHVRVSDGMATLTRPGHLENPEGKRHHDPADVVGKTDFDLYPPALAEQSTADDEQVIETGESIDDRVEHAYGDELTGTYVSTSKAPWYDEEGRIVGLVGVTQNITERKQYETQLERQNERLERFAGVVSHDLRNPLEVAMGRLEFARSDGDAEHFDAVERSLRRIDALIDDVLTLAREGETVSDPEPTDVGSTAEAAWAVVDTAEATLAVETDASLLADPGRLQQIFENVFRNSVEHGGPDVTVTVGDLDDRDGFFVADDGPGIPEEEHESVFDSGYSTSEEGTGLGLRIVRSIAEAHGWSVRLTASEPDGSGTRLEFETMRAENS